MIRKSGEVRRRDPKTERSWPPLVPRENPEKERKKVRIDTEWVLRPPLQGKSTPIPVREDLAIPSTSREIPTMTFTNRGILETTVNKSIRVKENIQIVPPREKVTPQLRAQIQLPPQRYEWIQVGKKGKKIKQDKKQNKITTKKKRRLPKIAAISIKGSSSDFSYAEALKRARSTISLKDLEIHSPKIRKGMSGSTIIEISGPDNAEKANKLAV